MLFRIAEGKEDRTNIEGLETVGAGGFCARQDLHWAGCIVGRALHQVLKLALHFQGQMLLEWRFASGKHLNQGLARRLIMQCGALPEAMPAKTNAEQIASRNLGWNIYFSRNLVERKLSALSLP